MVIRLKTTDTTEQRTAARKPLKTQPTEREPRSVSDTANTSYAVRPNRRHHRRLEYADKNNMLRSQQLSQHRIHALRHRRGHPLDTDGRTALLPMYC